MQGMTAGTDIDDNRKRTLMAPLPQLFHGLVDSETICISKPFRRKCLSTAAAIYTRRDQQPDTCPVRQTKQHFGNRRFSVFVPPHHPCQAGGKIYCSGCGGSMHLHSHWTCHL